MGVRIMSLIIGTALAGSWGCAGGTGERPGDEGEGEGEADLSPHEILCERGKECGVVVAWGLSAEDFEGCRTVVRANDTALLEDSTCHAYAEANDDFYACSAALSCDALAALMGGNSDACQAEVAAADAAFSQCEMLRANDGYADLAGATDAFCDANARCCDSFSICPVLFEGVAASDAEGCKAAGATSIEELASDPACEAYASALATFYSCLQGHGCAASEETLAGTADDCPAEAQAVEEARASCAAAGGA